MATSYSNDSIDTMCRGCGETKPWTTEFFSATGSGTHLRRTCRVCKNAASLDTSRKWKAAHKEHLAEYSKNRRKSYPEKVKGWTDAWKARNTEHLAAYRRTRRALDNATARSIPRNRLRDAVSGRMSASLRDGKRGRPWESLVGYTLFDLVLHLESLFTAGMSWENYGYRGWHIDHIRPVSSFEFESTDDEGFRECWDISNLQPLWAEDNLKKNARWEGAK